MRIGKLVFFWVCGIVFIGVYLGEIIYGDGDDWEWDVDDVNKVSINVVFKRLLVRV